jgi:hypothetical protein
MVDLLRIHRVLCDGYVLDEDFVGSQSVGDVDRAERERLGLLVLCGVGVSRDEFGGGEQIHTSELKGDRVGRVGGRHPLSEPGEFGSGSSAGEKESSEEGEKHACEEADA